MGAHSREVTPADRPYIDAVYQSAANQNFSLRAAVLAIVAHPEFGLCLCTHSTQGIWLVYAFENPIVES